MQIKFQPGQILATPGALEAIRASDQTPQDFLDRHLSGDWGDVCEEDHHLNDLALVDGSRILSAYLTRTGIKIWVLTEAAGDDDRRASTCIMLPENY